MDQIAYVNGSFVPLSEAKVSILDRGFLFADGIYEVAAVLDGKLIDNASHLARLERSVGEIALALPETTDRIQALRRALAATLEDPAFKADAEIQGMEITYVSGQDLEQLVAKIMSTPPEFVTKLEALLK